VRARVREHVPDPAPELLEREMAVRVDHTGSYGIEVRVASQGRRT
jgi:hypothetical protein